MLTLEDSAYNRYLRGIATSRTHEGYFSIDKKSKRLVEPGDGSASQAESDDVDAYDLILKNKERLLSFEEPVRFHLFALGAARGLGQSERVRDRDAEAQRQHGLAAGRRWGAACAFP